MSARIAVDARVIPRYPGLGRHCLNILRELSKIDKKNEYIIFTADSSLSFLEQYPNFHLVRVGFPVLSLKTLFSFARYINKERVDLFYCPFQVTPLRVSCPMVITVHDMMDLLYPDAFSHHPFLIRHGLNAYFHFNIPRSVRNARMLIAVSQSTKRHIVEYFHLPDEKIKVIYNGIESKFKPVSDKLLSENIKRKYQLPDRFILYLGSIKPYKNLIGVLKAFLKLQQNWPNLRQVKLIIAGLKHFTLPHVQEMLAHPAIKNQVIKIGHVDEEDLPVVYSLAELFLFPSLWEGFGIPPLEAMACGTPVITSDRTSLPEVVGQAGILVDPENTEQIAFEIQRVLNDEILRKQMIQKGIQQACKFRWDVAARETLGVLEDVIGRSLQTEGIP
jgi:glycosyltransferase involved in cell wall biosynthesis